MNIKNNKGVAQWIGIWATYVGTAGVLVILNQFNIIGDDSPRTVEKNRAKVIARGDTIINKDWVLEPMGADVNVVGKFGIDGRVRPISPNGRKGPAKARANVEWDKP